MINVLTPLTSAEVGTGDDAVAEVGTGTPALSTGIDIRLILKAEKIFCYNNNNNDIYNRILSL